MNLSWKKLAEEILAMPKDLQETSVTVYTDNDEFLPLNGSEKYDKFNQCLFFIDEDNDVLDLDHPIISLVPIENIQAKIKSRPLGHTSIGALAPTPGPSGQ